MFEILPIFKNTFSMLPIISSNNCERDSSWNDLEIKLGLRKPCPVLLKTITTPIIINTTHRNYFNNTPFYTIDVLSTVDNNYSELNDDKSVIKAVTKYYYYKTIEKFLKSEMIDLLGYLQIDGDNVKFIKNIKDHSDKLPTTNDTDKKIIFLEKNFLTKRMIHDILKKYIKKNNTVWYKVQNNEQEFKNYLHNKLKEIIEDKIKS
jgi:hypothetical protein